jgi:signal-transduction protein with cAMP-binding, CBS, and nucleotidyltransferase domain
MESSLVKPESDFDSPTSLGSYEQYNSVVVAAHHDSTIYSTPKLAATNEEVNKHAGRVRKRVKKHKTHHKMQSPSVDEAAEAASDTESVALARQLQRERKAAKHARKRADKKLKREKRNDLRKAQEVMKKLNDLSDNEGKEAETDGDFHSECFSYDLSSQ